MSTYSVLDEMKLKAPTWNRDGNPSLIAMLDRAQRFMFSKPCALTLYLDPSTGKYPYLVTTATEREYSIPDISYTLEQIERPLRIFKVHEVFVDAANRTLEYGIQWDYVDGDRIIIDGKAYTAQQNTKARFIFKDDPGSESEWYQYKGIIEPLRLTNDTIPLMVSEDWEPALIDGALGFIEYLDYGRSDRLQTFYDHWCPRFWNAEDSGNSSHEKKKATRVRTC